MCTTYFDVHFLGMSLAGFFFILFDFRYKQQDFFRTQFKDNFYDADLVFFFKELNYQILFMRW